MTVNYTGQLIPLLVNLSGQAYALVSIAIAPQTASIPIGAGRQFHALGSYSDGSVQDISASVTWTTSDTTKLTVGNSGLATGMAAGSAQITATSSTAVPVAASVNVNVTTATLVSLAVDTIYASLPQGYAQQFNAVGSYSDGTQLVLTNQVAWTSSAPAVASVGATGMVSTLGAGTVLVTAALGSVSSSAPLTVTGVMLQSIAISPPSVSMAIGTILQLQATGTYSDGSTRSLTNLASWSYSATNIATVSAIGRISSSPSQTGSGVISASFAGFTATAAAKVNFAHVRSISVAPNRTALPVAASQLFTATGAFTDGSSQDVSLLVHWTSSAADLATVANTLQSEGLASALAPGSVTIMASYLPSVSGRTILTVDTAALVSIAITPANSTVADGAAFQFTATGTYKDKSTHTLTQSVAWSAANSSSLLVSNDPGSQGFGYGLAAGQNTVTAALGPVAGSTLFTVAAPNLISISVNPQSATIVAGNTQQFTATGTYGDGSTQDLTASAAWSSTSSATGTVGNSPGNDGLALGVAQGQATIAAASGAVSGSGQLTVTAAQLVAIAVTPANPTITAGGSQQFTATGTYTDGSTQDLTTTAAWSASPAGEALIGNAAGSQGLAQGLAAGQATVKAASGAIAGSTALTINPAPPQLTSIAVSPLSATVFAGSSQQFTATGTYSDGSTQDLTATVTWSADPSTAASFANSPGSQGLAQALATGPATITAASGSISATAELSVVPLLISITVSPSSATVGIGSTQQFTATGAYSDGSSQDLTNTAAWSANPSTAAAVGNAPGSPGLAQAMQTGSTMIFASFASATGAAALTITPVLTAIGISPSGASLTTGSTQQFAATGTYSDGSTQDLTNQVTWSAAPAATATIAPGGLAQALTAGQATVTAILGAISSSTTLAVALPPTLVSLAVSPLTPTLAMGSSLQFYATGTYSDGSTQDLTSSAAWISFSPAVTTINSSGLATAIGTGATAIGASLGAINGATNSFSVVSAGPPPIIPALCQQSATGLPPLPPSVTLPALPQSCTVPAYPAPRGAPVVVNTAAALQNALTTAQCGQWIQVQAGVTYQGGFVVPGLACPADSPVLVENSAINATVACTPTSGPPCSSATVGQTIPVLPQWTVASQALAGTSYVPTLESTDTNSPLFISDGAANWYFSGIEVTLSPTATFIYPIVAMGENTTTVAALPQNITFDRILVHPAPCPADSVASRCNYVARGIDLNAVNGAVMFSSVWGIVSAGQDTQAINVNNSTGPGLIAGNYLEATGENLMFNTECTIATAGTGASGFENGDIGITTCPAPSDFTVRLNHFHKLMAWQTLPAGCNPSLSQCYDVKNQSEVKHGQRILYDSNVFDTTYAGAQAEFLISNCFYPGLYICQDLTYTNNLFEHGPQVGAVAGNGAPVTSPNCGGSGQPACTIQTGQRFLFQNNVAVDINGDTYGGTTCVPSTGANCASGLSFQVQNTNGFIMDHNTIVNAPSLYQNGLNFTDAQPSTDLNLQLTNNFQFGSPFNDGGSPGGAIAMLPTPTFGGQVFVGDYWQYPNVWDVIYTPLYPAGITSLSANSTPVSGQPNCQNNNYPLAQCWPLDWALVGFVDFAGGNAATDLPGLALGPASPYLAAGTDGLDIGANVAAVLAAISTVQ
ncbi:MAG: Ig-like domain-containing protein [Bryobacteraceae bacterium]